MASCAPIIYVCYFMFISCVELMYYTCICYHMYYTCISTHVFHVYDIYLYYIHVLHVYFMCIIYTYILFMYYMCKLYTCIICIKHVDYICSTPVLQLYESHVWYRNKTYITYVLHMQYTCGTFHSLFCRATVGIVLKWGMEALLLLMSHSQTDP